MHVSFSPEIVEETTVEERAAMTEHFRRQDLKEVAELAKVLTEFSKCPEEYNIEDLAKDILGVD